MNNHVYIIDGYNAIHQVPRWEQLLDQSLEAAREALLRYCARWIRERGDAWLIYVVFDGQSDQHHEERGYGSGVRIVYTRSSEEADDRILAIVREWGSTHDYIVVSDDRYVWGTARRHGAKRISCAQFADTIRTPSSTPSRNADKTITGKDSGITPSQAKAITDELAALWCQD
jgi:predicted RNA-binding protein with PIN domain